MQHQRMKFRPKLCRSQAECMDVILFSNFPLKLFYLYVGLSPRKPKISYFWLIFVIPKRVWLFKNKKLLEHLIKTAYKNISKKNSFKIFVRNFLHVFGFKTSLINISGFFNERSLLGKYQLQKFLNLEKSFSDENWIFWH